MRAKIILLPGGEGLWRFVARAESWCQTESWRGREAASLKLNSFLIREFPKKSLLLVLLFVAFLLLQLSFLLKQMSNIWWKRPLCDCGGAVTETWAREAERPI